MEDPTLKYVKRIRNAILISVLVHVGVFGAYTAYPHKEKIGTSPIVQPITLQLQPPQESQERKSFIDSVIPSPIPPQNDTNIAEQNAVATDTLLNQGDESAPRFDKIADMDVLPVPINQKQAPSPPSDAIPEPELTEEEPEPAETESQLEPDISESTISLLADQKKKETTTPKDKPKQKSEERVQVAMEQSIPSLPVPPTPPSTEQPHEGRSKNNNRGVEQVGLAGYEAIQDDLAPYLKNMKAQVDLYWKEKMLLHYTGSKPTKVEIDCEIDHNGHLVSVEIVGKPKDKLYAAMCKQALVLAAPFGPFTFEVPDIYRNQNLEIRWSFNFL